MNLDFNTILLLFIAVIQVRQELRAHKQQKAAEQVVKNIIAQATISKQPEVTTIQ